MDKPVRASFAEVLQSTALTLETFAVATRLAAPLIDQPDLRALAESAGSLARYMREVITQIERKGDDTKS